MKRLILLTAIFAVMCVTTSHAMTILIDGAYLGTDPTGAPIVTWFQQNFPGATVTAGDFSDPSGSAAHRTSIEAADLLVINRRTYSGAYDLADGVYYSGLTKPVIFLTSYVTRISRIGFEGGANAGSGVGGSETTVTADGAARFGVAAGTYDFYTAGFDTLGTGSVGTGKILATIGGNHLAVFWGVGDTDGSARVQAGKRLLYNIDAVGGTNLVLLPDTAAGLAAFSSVIKSFIARTDSAHDPVVTPTDTSGKSGNIVKVSGVWQVHDVVLGFTAGKDPNTTRAYPVNPAIKKHNIYLQTGASTDPNLYLYDSVTQVYNADPYLTNPNVSYGPLPDTLLKPGTVYNWKVEEVLSDPNGNPYPNGSAQNIMGDVWNFTTVTASPEITTSPAHTLTDTSGNATLSIVTTSVSNNYRWFKVVGVQDTTGGETDDIKLTDTGIYSGTTTKTLIITGAASNGSNDAQVYAIAYNGDPEGAGIASAPSTVAWFWYPRLVNYYPFETLTGGVTPDAASGYNMTVLSNDTGTDVPALNTNVVPGITGDTQSLKFNNPRGTDPNTTDAQYAQINGSWVGGYKDITISAWVYSSGGSSWNRIVDFGNDTNNYVFVCVNTGSVNRQLRFAVKVAGTEQTVSSVAVLPDNEWTYVSCTLTGNTARIYVNGTLDTTNAALTNDPVSFGPSVQNWIGRSQWGAGDGYFNGMLDELKIYNYARTTDQVAHDYLTVKGGWICDRELYNLPYDFNNDCIVDLSDFATFAATWLNSYRIY